jgi:hypothetical protein
MTLRTQIPARKTKGSYSQVFHLYIGELLVVNGVRQLFFVLCILPVGLGFIQPPCPVQGVTEEFPIGLVLTYTATWDDERWVEQYVVLRWATEVGENIVEIDFTNYTGTSPSQYRFLVNAFTWGCVNPDGTPSTDVVSPPLWQNTSSWRSGTSVFIPGLDQYYRIWSGSIASSQAGSFYSWRAYYHSSTSAWSSYYITREILFFEEDSGVLLEWSYEYDVFPGDYYNETSRSKTLTFGNLRSFGIRSQEEMALPGVLLGALILYCVIIFSFLVYRRPTSSSVIEVERTVPDWIRLLTNNLEHPDVRQRAAQALGQSGDFRSTKHLLDVLRSDTHSRVRRAVAQALGNLRDRRAVKSLIDALLHEPNIDVQRGTAWALGQIGDRQAVNPLVQVLRNAESDELRQSAVVALGQLGDHGAIIPLMHALQHDESIDVKWSAALTLQERWDSLSQTQQPLATRLIRDLPLRTVEDDDVELEPPAIPVLQPVQCMSCGETVSAEGTVCAKCGNPLHQCMVCQRRIGQGERHSRCPYCGTLAHSDHLLQWLKIRTVCPHCQRSLHPTDLKEETN